MSTLDTYFRHTILKSKILHLEITENYYKPISNRTISASDSVNI